MNYTTVRNEIKGMIQKLNPMYWDEEAIDEAKEDLFNLKNDLTEELDYYVNAVEETEDIINRLEQVETLAELYETDKDWNNSFTLTEFMLEYAEESVEDMVDDAVMAERDNACLRFNECGYDYLSIQQVEGRIESLRGLISKIESAGI